MEQPIDIYARVSRKGDKQQRSTTGQVGVCRAVLKERGLPLGRVLVDDGRSAWNPKVARPDWDVLMSRLESGASGGVCVFDLERFARRPADGERLITASERGITVLDSDGEFDLATASGKKAFRDAMAAAAYYSDRLSTRTRRGKQAKAMAGEVDARRSFGFEPDGITVCEAEAGIIRDAAQRLLAGESQEALMAELTARHVATVRGAPWGYTTLRQVMLRPRNRGLIVHDGAVVPGVRLPGKPILDAITYDRLVALYASRRPGRPPSGRYLMTGIAGCVCGATLSGRPVTGTPRRQYWCKTCRRTFVDVDRLDEWAGDFVVRTLSDPAHADAVSAAEAENETWRAALTAEVASIEATLTDISGRLGRSEPGWTLARHDAVCTPLEARLADLGRELSRAKPEPALPAVRTISRRDQNWVHWLEAWDVGTTTERRSYITRALAGRRIVVGPGKSAKFDPDRVTVE